MLDISIHGRHYYQVHGWTDEDIDFLLANGELIEEGERWVMGVGKAEDGVIWLYPTSPGNVFPLTLWKRIKWYIENNESVVIPMDKNMKRVSNAAKRYNGYLQDNLYMFGNELAKLKIVEGGQKWSHSTSSPERTTHR